MFVVVELYSPEWAEEFEKVKTELVIALAGVDYQSIEHVGSTSIESLATKPILDIDIVVTCSNVPAAIAALEEFGYTFQDWGIADRHALVQPYGTSPSRHVYVCVEGSLALRNHPGLRDVLRSDRALRDEYAAVKYGLARESPNDVNAYCESKNAIINKILGRAGLSNEDRAAIEEVNTIRPPPAPCG